MAKRYFTVLITALLILQHSIAVFTSSRQSEEPADGIYISGSENEPGMMPEKPVQTESDNSQGAERSDEKSESPDSSLSDEEPADEGEDEDINDDISGGNGSFTVVFTVSEESASFEGSLNEVTVLLVRGSRLSVKQIPKITSVKPGIVFKGWRLNESGNYSSEELCTIDFENDTVINAVFSSDQVKNRSEKKAESLGSDVSVSSILNSADLNKIAVIDLSDTSYQVYTADTAGLRLALYGLYQSGSGSDYILYIGKSITLSSDMCRKAPQPNPDASTISFSALSGRVNSLTIVGSASDPVSGIMSPPSDAVTLTFSSQVFMGCSVKLRNIRYTLSELYMQGNSLILDYGSYVTSAASYFGGTDNTVINGNPSITVYTVGYASGHSFYGGNKSGGTVNGNITLTFNSTSGSVNIICGGSSYGRVNGNIALSINSFGGNIGTVYGGGIGTSSVQSADVSGNVTLSINDVSGTVVTIYGGVYYGEVEGYVSTSVSGSGKGTAESVFHGGSYSGNIGAGLPDGSDAIINDVDLSGYASGSFIFIGANRYSGSIYGNIHSTVTAGEQGEGSLRAYFGGTNELNAKTVDVSGYPLETRAANFEAASVFRVYGNITNIVKKGYIGTKYGWFRGAGYSGYIEGNITSVLGEDGLVHGGDSAGQTTTPSPLLHARGYLTGFDITNGGGTPEIQHLIYIKGNLKLVQKFVLARYTVGANFSGYVEGNAVNELYEGVVDTLEGGGYNSRGIYGNTSVYMYGGQVDWYLTAGGYDDDIIEGDVYAEIHGGVINASVSGTYGATTTHTVTGNSEILIKGGDFYGYPRDGADSMCSGPNNYGTIRGNGKLTIDLRGGAYFRPPQDSHITGGRRYNSRQNQVLGTTAMNSAELNIFTDEGETALSSADIYGDGGTGEYSGSPGIIIINIDAPGAQLGNILATQYSNTRNSTYIVRNVVINITNAGTIRTLSGGNLSDSFKNAAAGHPSAETVTVNAGNSESSADIMIGSGGLYNFTDLNISTVVLYASGGGSIKNGKDALSSNFSSLYSGFGNISLKDKGGIGIVKDSSGVIICSRLSAEDDTRLATPSGGGRVIIKEFYIEQGESLIWTRNGGSAMVSVKGTWFGTKTAYQVLTFASGVSQAQSVRPDSIFGIESDGKTYIADNDKTSGHGVVLSGSVVEFYVSKGEGSVMHNADGVSSVTAPVQVYGYVQKDTPVRSGRLCIPASGVKPVLTFIPDAQSNSKIKEIAVVRSDGDIQIIGEKNAGITDIWNCPRLDFSYEIDAEFESVPVLTAVNAVISESEAFSVTITDIAEYNKAEGLPSLTGGADADIAAAIREPLGEDQLYRVHLIEYSAGSGDAAIYLHVNIVVVKDGSIIAEDRSCAIYANGAAIMIEQANSLSGHSELASKYTNAIAVSAEGISCIPYADEDSIAAIRAASEASQVTVHYSYLYDINEPELRISVLVEIQTSGVRFVFYKVDAADLNIYLAGAEFALYIPGENAHLPGELVTDAGISSGKWTPYTDSDGLPAEEISGSDGKVSFGYLRDGIYMLVETSAPSGYERPAGQWMIIISSEDSENQIQINSLGAAAPPPFVSHDGKLLLTNLRPFILPATGGRGYGVHMLLGSAVIILAASLNFKKKKNYGG